MTALYLRTARPRPVSRAAKRRRHRHRPSAVQRAGYIWKWIAAGRGCIWCADPLDLAEATLEHMLPIARGGRSRALGNLAVSHQLCNGRRGDSVSKLATWVRWGIEVPTVEDIVEDIR